MSAAAIGAIDRLWRPYFFVYDYTLANAGLSYRTSRLWLVLWLVMDLIAQSTLGPTLVWDTAISLLTFLVVWRLPPLLACALAGLHIVRAGASMLMGFGVKAGADVEVIGWGLLGWQLWAILASLVLLLKYVRTPKKLMPAVPGRPKE